MRPIKHWMPPSAAGKDAPVGGLRATYAQATAHLRCSLPHHISNKRLWQIDCAPIFAHSRVWPSRNGGKKASPSGWIGTGALKVAVYIKSWKSPAAMPGPGTGGEINLEAGMVNYALRIMYKFHRRKESSKSWRSRYTPKWKSLYKDWALRLGSRRGTIYSNAASQLDRPRATVSRSSARLAPSGYPEANYFSSNFYTNFEANISPTRAAAPALYDALATQKYYLPANQNSGGGRTEETSDRANQQQIDRSRNSNRTQACGTEIAAGTASAYGWTTFPAEVQVAAIEMRVGQNGVPLPFESNH